jgi:hypothetical protein
MKHALVMHCNVASQNVIGLVVSAHVSFRRKPLIEIARDGCFPTVRVLTRREAIGVDIQIGVSAEKIGP